MPTRRRCATARPTGQPTRRRLLAAGALWPWAIPAVSAVSAGATTTPGYDPLALAGAAPEPFDELVRDAARSDREIPLRLTLPAAPGPAPLLLFSHGLGGSRQGSPFIARHWAARGYVTAWLQHPGSDEGVWRGASGPAAMLRALRAAATASNLRLRVEDVRAVIDALLQRNARAGDALAGRIDPARIGLAGHSFGAQTTQIVAGQQVPGLGTRHADARVRAAVVMSPSPPAQGLSPAEAFGGVDRPWLLMTGTEDSARLVGGADAAVRRLVYPALPPGAAYELVLDGAQHAVFTDRPLPGEQRQRNPAHHAAILAISTAFWDAHLRGDPAARAWLDGEGPRRVLAAADGWQRK